MVTKKKNQRGLDYTSRGPDDTTNDKKDTQPDEAQTEQRRGPNNGTYNVMTKERQVTSVPTEDENVDQIHWSKITY